MDPVSQYDNDFEQVEHREADDGISSTTEPEHVPETHQAVGAREAEPLISFGDEAAPVAQHPKPAIIVAAAPAAVVHPACEKTEGQSSCHCCCSFANMDPRVKELLLWTDLKKSGAVLVSLLSVLLSLAMFSIVSVIAYTALIALTITVTFRLYKTVMGAVQKSSEAHPFKNYLECELTLNENDVHRYADLVVKYGQKVVADLRHLILIEDMIDSLKFALFSWVLTYIGSWFNGMTLIILGVVGVFSVPKLYDLYREQIDQHLGVACTKIHETYSMVQEKIPFLKKKQE